MAANEPTTDRTLPSAFRGYGRERVDSLLEEIERSYRALIAERDELRANLESTTKALSEATAELEQHVALVSVRSPMPTSKPSASRRRPSSTQRKRLGS